MSTSIKCGPKDVEIEEDWEGQATGREDATMKAHEAAKKLGESSCFGECPQQQSCRYLETLWQLKSVKYEEARKLWVVKGTSKGTCRCELDIQRGLMQYPTTNTPKS